MGGLHIGVLYTTVDHIGTASGRPWLSGSTISYQKNGVLVSGTGAEVTIQGNTVTGLGTIDFIAQNGIQISAGASATVIGNSVSNNFYTAKSYTATGCSALICRLHG